MYFRKHQNDTHPGIKLLKNTQKLFHSDSNQVRQSGWRTDQKHSFLKFTSILKHTAVTVPAAWMEPAWEGSSTGHKGEEAVTRAKSEPMGGAGVNA